MSPFTKGVLVVITIWLAYNMGYLDGAANAREAQRQTWIEPEFPQE